MKRKLIFTLLLCTTLATFAGAQSFTGHQKDLNIGIGLGDRLVLASSTSSFPPVSVSLDFGVSDQISVGGYLGFAGARWSVSGTDWCNHGPVGYYTYVDTYHWSFYLVGVRGAFHFVKFIPNDKVDLYAGLMLGDNYAHYHYTTTDHCQDSRSYIGPDYGGFIWSGFLGARYRFNDHVGIFGELGYGISYLSVGLNYKF